MANFTLAHIRTSKAEGFWCDVPGDAGGETYAGVARNFFPNWAGWVLIDEYHKQPGFPGNIDHKKMAPYVEKFFKVQFWDVMRLDEVVDQSIAEEIYDTGVNMGTKKAIEIVQRACNLLNKQGALYPELTVDGIIGKNTLKTINGHPHPRTLFNLLNVLQGARYVELAEAKPINEKFMRGWLDQRVITK